MKYAEIYPDAVPFIELADKLFKVFDEYTCCGCGEKTPFLDYTFDDLPVATCSGTCFQVIRSEWENLEVSL